MKKVQPVLLAFLFMCAAGAALGWLWFAVEEQGARLISRMQTIENEQAFEARFNELISMVEETELERERLQQYILRGESDTIQLLSRLDAIAKKHRVELGTSGLSVEEREGTFDDLLVGFQISGVEANVMRMIEMFETLPYHGSIESLSISRQRDEAGERTVSAHISLALSIQEYDQ